MAQVRNGADGVGVSALALPSCRALIGAESGIAINHTTVCWASWGPGCKAC
jgi:hypothetical protein